MKVGDYVRTEEGTITRIKMFYGKEWKEPKLTYARFLCEDMGIYEYPRNVKVSSNIINLIEVGDYVNGLKVTSISGTWHGRKDKAIYCDYCENKKTGKWTMFYDDEIKTIVTKEQFESMQYEVK